MEKAVIGGKEWAQIQEECLWEDREEWRRLCDKEFQRVDTDTRGVLMGRQRRMEKAL
jgi:hypothetical protein